MKMRGIILLLFLAASLPINAWASKTIREVEADESQVVLVRTALGYSTIVEFGSKPLSAVVGDQDAFKLEYVKNSITIKPLLPHAVSNLFVFTEYGRFNCTLKTVSQAEVDYIVRISSPSQKPIPLLDSPAIANHSAPPQPVTRTSSIEKKAIWKGYSLKVVSSSRVNGSGETRPVTVFDIELDSKRRPYSFSAASLGIKQGRHFIPIESIYLDSLDLRPGYPPLRGKIALLNQDYRPSETISLVFAVPGHRIEVIVPGSSHSQIGLKQGPQKGK